MKFIIEPKWTDSDRELPSGTDPVFVRTKGKVSIDIALRNYNPVTDKAEWYIADCVSETPDFIDSYPVDDTEWCRIILPSED